MFLNLMLLLLAMAILAVAGMIFTKFKIYIIPALFAVTYIYVTILPNYLGYAIEDRFVQGKEALMLGSIQTDEWIHILVQFKNENEPRLVKIERTESNEKALENQGRGTRVIVFGTRPSESSGSSVIDDNASIGILPMNESNMFSK